MGTPESTSKQLDVKLTIMGWESIRTLEFDAPIAEIIKHESPCAPACNPL